MYDILTWGNWKKTHDITIYLPVIDCHSKKIIKNVSGDYKRRQTISPLIFYIVIQGISEKCMEPSSSGAA